MVWTELTTFVGWCLVINAAILMLATIAVVFFRPGMLAIHTRLLGASEAELTAAYIHYLSLYKVAIFVLNLTPYLAPKMMGY